MTPTDRLHARARARRARLVVRAWELRQIAGSKGTWYRLRLALAFAEKVYAVDAETLAALLAEGFRREAVGAELEPTKDLVFVPKLRAASLLSARPLAVRLSPELLAERHLVLIPFDGITP